MARPDSPPIRGPEAAAAPEPRVVATASSQPIGDPRPAPARPLLAADVGGTHVRVAIVHAAGGSDRALEVSGYRKFAAAEFASLADVLAVFLSEHGALGVQDAAIACAGYPLADGTYISVNLPWPVSPRAIRERLGLRALRVVNDFEAAAHATAELEAAQMQHLSGPATGSRGPRLVLGPGTGFGAAVWVPVDGGAVVLPTEAGMSALTVGNEVEIALLREWLRERDPVPVEHALSGPGLLRIHRTLCRLHGRPSSATRPDEVTAAAQAGDADARASLDVFCGLLGATVGSLAMLYGIRSGIYLAGGILPRLGDALRQGSFVPRLLGHGPMREALERIPVKLVEHGQLGVLGAARWYLDRAAREAAP